MTSRFSSAALTRRDTLKLIGLTVGTATAASLMPLAARAQGAASGLPFASPLPCTRVPASSPLATAYDAALTRYSGAMTPNTLYALSATTRSAMPFAGMNYTAAGYWDAYGAASNAPPVGPTLTFTRNTTVGVWLQNTMDSCGTNNNMPMTDPKSEYTPHGYITTNLHTHGLHVSPNAPSDDVLLMISSANDDQTPPTSQTTFPYNYAMPATHPVGTFWYHPHKHGSVSSQMATGMAGALIVRSQGAANNDTDIDDLLAAAPYNITEADEEILVLQTINYFPAGGNAATFDPDAYYNGSNATPPGSSCFNIDVSAGQSKTSVNGLVQPSLTMKKGEIKRFRIINASIGQAFVPVFEPADTTSGTPPDVYVLATDGITLEPPYALGTLFKDDAPYFKVDYSLTKPAEPITDADREAAALYWTTAELITVAPGQRVDLLVQAVDSGSFILRGADFGTAPTVVESARPGSGISVVNTDPLLTLTVGTDTRSDQALPPLSLYRNTAIQRPKSMSLDGKTIPPATQTLEFKTIDSAFSSNGITEPPFLINDQHFDMEAPKAQLQLYLDDTDVWNLYSSNDAHIFHIHINSFQAFARVPYNLEARTYRVPVFYLLPVWRDTVYFDSSTSKNNVYAPGTMLLATSTQLDFTGEFVLHCHNLFHEDNGMMLTVSIQDPGDIGAGKSKPVNRGLPASMRTKT